MEKSKKVYTLKNKNGIEVNFMADGGRIIGINVPDSSGNIADVVIGYKTPEEALNGDSYFGAICGRYANRIVGGKFSIDGKEYQLDKNDGNNHLHGGIEGFNSRNWNVEEITDKRFAQAYKLTLTSPDGDQKYPGKLEVSVIYGLTEDNSFTLEYEAETDKPTVINLTSHAYFNLKGAGSGTVEQHSLKMFASKYTPIDKNIGTVSGEIVSVKNTPFDFVENKKIGEALKQKYEQLENGGGGLDHNFVIDNFDGNVKLVAQLSDQESGRKMDVFTNQPGIQLYTGNHFDGTDIGKQNKPIEKWAGIAMETQIFPNSPNVEHFPDATLRPGEKYTHTCIYKFSW